MMSASLHDYNIPATPLKRSRRVEYFLKRVFDVLFALGVVGLLLSWLTPVLAVLIKLDSPGPVFFKQLRTGRHGRPFYCYKFRSMRLNADADAAQARRGDGRITRLGRWLRARSVDELPQFWNVLRGDMSVVGPRPHMLGHTRQYAGQIPGFMRRHTVAPGITGLAQVAGHRGETRAVEDMERRVAADLHYIAHWSLGLDGKIVLLTVYQALKGHHNAF